MLAEQLQEIEQSATAAVGGIQSRAEWEVAKARFFGPSGSLTQLMKGLGKLPAEERPAAGQSINKAKVALEKLFESALKRVEAAEVAALLGEPIDPTLPSPDGHYGAKHPITQVFEKATAIFRKAGFTVADGPELETEWYNFDALNTPAGHPARNEQDTFYYSALPVPNVQRHSNERYLLRSHTSTVQIRSMFKSEPPLRIIAPGRVFRRDTVDATHSANFHQIEGLYVDRNVTVQDLKAILDFFVHEFFGSNVETRLRPSFFPFTEPSFEMDMRCASLGKLSGRWVEIWGCGMVNPAVFRAVNYDPEVWSGYAFGMGAERLAMLLYGIDDVRHFYQNDARFLSALA